ncbi:MAG: TIGR04149 family rSAM-modified RiPP [Bergeyella sp.]
MEKKKKINLSEFKKSQLEVSKLLAAKGGSGNSSSQGSNCQCPPNDSDTGSDCSCW